MATPQTLSDGRPDGCTMSASASEKVSLYGVTPVVQAATIAAVDGSSTVTQIGVAVGALITAAKNLGIVAAA